MGLRPESALGEQSSILKLVLSKSGRAVIESDALKGKTCRLYYGARTGAWFIREVQSPWFEWLYLGRMWEFPKIRGTFLEVLIIRILLFRALYQGHLFSETPMYRGFSCRTSLEIGLLGFSLW